jgi:tRNA (guanine-N7-)-methyltransferase
MGQKKLIRFEELKEMPNVLQFPEQMPGNWNQFFKNNHPIILELACGKGEYAVGLGSLYPHKNFIGIDLKGNRLWVGARKALQNNLTNVAFLRTQIDQITNYFSKDEVQEIWITFPDPQLRMSKAKKRLTHPKFLRLYQLFLVAGGLIHLKTDSPELYQFTKLVIDLYGCPLHQDIDDVYKQENIASELKITTHYESLDIAGANKIHYLCFSLPEIIPTKEKDAELKQLLKEAIEPTEYPGELTEDIDYYFNEDGLMVFTRNYLMKKSYCCGNGCENCPYDYQNVKEPERSELIQRKLNAE